MYIEKNSCFIPQREEKMSEKTLAVLNDAAIRFDGRRLTMENNLVSRTIDFFRGYPETVSFRRIDLDREFADPEEPGCGVSFSGITPPGMYDVAFQLEGVTAKSVPAGWAETAHLEAEVTMYEPVQQVRFRVTYFLYPGVPAVGVQAAILSRVMPNLYWSYRREMRSANDFLPVEQSSGAVDGFRLAPGFAPECSLEPVARTDVHDDLLLDHPALPGEEFFRGNLLWCRNRAGAGVLVLQESSPSGERRDWAEFDFMVRDRRLRSCAWNAAPWELSPEVEIESGRSVTILAADEVERDCRLKDYLRGRFPTAPETHVAMVNPWGCGRFRELVGEEFLRREIEATAACGAECYQIDDTWQQGEGLGRLINVNEHLTPAFWKISETRLRGTFAGLLPIAAQSKVELALWCAPSSNVEFRDWEAFREFLLDFHRRWNFRFFKIDGVKIRTCEAERNLETLLRSVREATGGLVYFNLDTTAGQRPGYFRMVEYGNIFLENRYVCHEWGLGYHPEKTLRSLWQLARVMRPQLLQVEIPSPSDIRRSFYEAKGMSQPDLYPVEYWAAIALFANPLLWFAPSTVPEEIRSRIRPLLELWRRNCDTILGGEIYPVGKAPDGKALTGLVSSGGWLIAFRELGAPEAGEFRLSHFPEAEGRRWRLVAGQGRAEPVPGGVALRLPEHPRFALFQLER